MAKLTTTVFEHDTPAYASAELDRLYGARYASLWHFTVAGMAAGASTYVARCDGVITALLLYSRRHGVIRVLNEGIRLTTDVAASFAACMFQRYPGVVAIRWHCIEAGAAIPAYAQQRLAYAEDTVLALPAGAADYLTSLGDSTRANIKLRLNRLKRDCPTMTFTCHERGAVDPADVRDIIRLSRLRMAHKGKTSTIDAAEEERIVRAIAEYGYVTTVRIDGQLCAGVVLYRQGRNFSLRVVTHAAAYDSYRLGFVCTFLSISACADLPGSGLFNFGWGREDYKLRLGGRRRELSTLLLYRSRRHALLAAPLACWVRLSGLPYRLRQHALADWWRARRDRQRQPAQARQEKQQPVSARVADAPGQQSDTRG